MSGSRKIKDLPLLSRPREKALYYGINTLSEAELIALIIGQGMKGESALYLAQKLLERHYSLQNIYKISDPRLLMMPGIGKVKALQIIAISELNRRLVSYEEQKDDLKYDELRLVYNYQRRIGRLQKETFFVIGLDRRNQIISEKQLYIGNEKGFVVDAKEVVRELLIMNAERYILIHNHPSGLVKPSQNDLKTTEELAKATAKFGVYLYDHIIISASSYYSMRNHQKS